jgi:hypothetical protein
MKLLEGGCACGAIRYRTGDPPRDCGYCHCRICQRTGGAPCLVFASFRRASVAWSGDAPRVYRSSPVGERWFCGSCGTQVAMYDHRAPGDVELAVATLDDPAAAPPGFHIWTSSQVPWFEIRDDLPRYAEGRPG